MRRRVFVDSVVPVLIPIVPWNPLQLGANLVAFWDASAGVVLSGANVITWTDQSPNAYVLGLNTISGANAPASPTFNATSFNGNPGITFAGVSGIDGQYLTTTVNAVSFGTNTSSFFMSATISNTSVGNARWLSTDNNINDDYAAPDGVLPCSKQSGTDALQWYQHGAGGTVSSIGFDTPYRYGVVFDNVNGTTYINNIQQDQTAAVFTLNAVLRVAVGNGYGAGSNINGIARRIVITKSAVSAADRSNIDTWLQG